MSLNPNQKYAYLSFLILLTMGISSVHAEPKSKSKKAKKKQEPFAWVNKPKALPPNVEHATFKSPSLSEDVGYCIYLPDAYKKQKNKKFPVVYYLHGGRPGSEKKSVRLAKNIGDNIKTGKVPPMIYVFVNGGPVSHYNMPDNPKAQGADVFIKELIPHIDKTYRTIADRNGRGLEGFSQGGRGTARLMFRHPDLFCSAAPGGGGHATEKKISESGGFEHPKLKFAEGDNTYDLAKQYSKNPTPKLNILVYVGNKGFNYQNNLEYMKYLDSLNIPYQKIIIPDAPHSGSIIYNKKGVEIMNFHARNFAKAGN